MKIAVLAVQGAFIEHERKLEALGVSCVELRKAEDLNQSYDGLVLPGGENFPRIRIGVGAKPRPDYDLADWVLGRFPPDDAKALADRCPDIAAAAKLIMDGKLGLAQSKYNG